MMKKMLLRNFIFRFFFSILFFVCKPVLAQNPNCFRITFSDKNSSPYSIDRPEEFLSSRAIAKRLRFNIPVTEEDLPVNPQYIEYVKTCINSPAYLISTSKWNNSAVILYSEMENYQQFIDTLYDLFPFVTDVQPVAYYHTAKKYSPSIHDEQISDAIVSVPHKNYNYGNSIEQIGVHNGQFLHQAGFRGENMLICVFDVGWTNFDTIPYFQTLYENGQIWGTRDLIPEVNNVYTGHEHGTAVTSIMASNIEGELVGTAPKANYYFIRSDDPWREQLVEEDFWAQAAEIADSLGADVINSSLGYSEFDDEWQNIYTPADNNGIANIASRAASILAQKGVIVVNAAGNLGDIPWYYISQPADAFNILAVGAVDKEGVVASFSSYGPSIDGRVKPDVASVGKNTWLVNMFGDVVQGSGTSFAAPVIAGLSACLWQALPQYSSLELMQLIREYGDCYHNPNDRTGYGIPNYYQLYLDHATNVPEKKRYPLVVYPNPTTGQLRIMKRELEMVNYPLHDRKPIETEVEVFDMMGRKSHVSYIMCNEQREFVMDISHLPAGIYFLQIISDTFSERVKVVKK